MIEDKTMSKIIDFNFPRISLGLGKPINIIKVIFFVILGIIILSVGIYIGIAITGSQMANVSASKPYSKKALASYPVSYSRYIRKNFQNPNCCTSDLIDKGYECLENCSDPSKMQNRPKFYNCLSPDNVKLRDEFGCKSKI